MFWASGRFRMVYKTFRVRALILFAGFFLTSFTISLLPITSPNYKKTEGSSSQEQWETFEPVPGTRLFLYNNSANYGTDLGGKQFLLLFGVYERNEKENARRAVSIETEVLCLLRSKSGMQYAPAVFEQVETRFYYQQFGYVQLMIWCHNNTETLVSQVALVNSAEVSSLLENKYERLSVYQGRGSNKLCSHRHKCIATTQFIPVKEPQYDDGNPSDRVAVCYKHLHSFTSAASLVEVFELQRLLGASRLFIYGYSNVSKAVENVIRYYQNSGFLYVQPWRESWPVGSYGVASSYHGLHQYGQHMANTHCVHTFGHAYEFMAFGDLDEFIVPTNTEAGKMGTYQELLSSLYADDEGARHSVCQIISVWLPFCVTGQHLPHRREPGLFTHQYRMSHVYELPGKMLVRSDQAYSLETHRVQLCRDQKMLPVWPPRVPRSVAVTVHYRHFGPRGHGVEKCEKEEHLMDRYTARLQARVDQATEDIQGFL